MADYFTQFSCILELNTAENAERALEILHNLRFEFAGEGMDVLFDASVEDDSPTTLWIREEDTGDTEHVIEFVRRCGKQLNLKGPWGFEWANSCSHLILESFGGGAYVLDLATGDEIDFIATHHWLETRIKAEVCDA